MDVHVINSHCIVNFFFFFYNPFVCKIEDNFIFLIYAILVYINFTDYI